MDLVQLLLHSLLAIDGEALLLHAGRRPCVHSPHGAIELTPHELSPRAVSALMARVLAPPELQAFAEVGAAQSEMLDVPGFPGECFNVVAARDGAHVWLEVRRGVRVLSVSARRTVPARAKETRAPAPR